MAASTGNCSLTLMPNRRALYSWGIKHKSANVTLDPNEYRPACFSHALTKASNPFAIKKAAHSCWTWGRLREYSSIILFCTEKFWRGWQSATRIMQRRRTWARWAEFSGSNRSFWGKASSRYSNMAMDCVSSKPSIFKAGTLPDGFTCRYSSEFCCPSSKLIEMISNGISFKRKASRTRQLQELL